MKTTLTNIRMGLMTLVSAIIIIATISTTANAVDVPAADASRMSANGIALAGGKVFGVSFDGIFWTAEEYAEMFGATRAAQPVDVSIDSENETLGLGVNEAFGLDLTSEDLEKLSREISFVIADSESEAPDESSDKPVTGMSLAVEVDDETGEETTILGGYKFKADGGTELNALMSQLQRWDLEENAYISKFFSRNWTYQTIQVEDGMQSVMVDAEAKTLSFCVVESITELSDWEVMAAQRLVVVRDQIDIAAAAAEAAATAKK